jgi:hypothetical protein
MIGLKHEGKIGKKIKIKNGEEEYKNIGVWFM